MLRSATVKTDLKQNNAVRALPQILKADASYQNIISTWNFHFKLIQNNANVEFHVKAYRGTPR